MTMVSRESEEYRGYKIVVNIRDTRVPFYDKRVCVSVTSASYGSVPRMYTKWVHRCDDSVLGVRIERLCKKARDWIDNSREKHDTIHEKERAALNRVFGDNGD